MELLIPFFWKKVPDLKDEVARLDGVGGVIIGRLRRMYFLASARFHKIG